MDADYVIITLHLIGALVAGGVIGLERSFHARPAGFRTHTLVCLASSLLMLVTLYQWKWLPGVPLDTIRTDPTRMAQGIMTGIGFLGAGVIFKEGLSVRGLTTAASIWITAAIGILMGVGFYFPAILATVLTIGILSVFRWLEAKMPQHSYAHHHIRFARNEVMTEAEVRALLVEHGFTVSNISYRTSDDGLWFEYRMVIRTTRADNPAALATSLRGLPQVRSFRISPTGD
ncbi:MAG: magnesium transporter MgtC [Candidatus Accumulibacter sp. 66-26]|nr:MgtC/SapB family protein [Accumulibacter sp.]OJW52345.1 MAG: magnesium transporter MgtC [Candidatus Accumulibacter sp. 66-26]